MYYTDLPYPTQRQPEEIAKQMRTATIDNMRNNSSLLLASFSASSKSPDPDPEPDPDPDLEYEVLEFSSS